MKRNRLIAVIVILALVAAAAIGAVVFLLTSARQRGNVVTVGFIYDNEEKTPYSYAFLLAQEAAQSMYQGKVKVMMISNVMEEQLSVPLRSMIDNNCDIIFTNCYGDMRTLAKQYPDVQFCQVSSDPYPASEASPNYHTFKGRIYEGRYLSGVIAGMKLKQLIDSGELAPEDAKLGFVAAYPYTEVISGYTAFILGARSVVPEATLLVRYTYTWSSYTKEKQCAERLLDDGCVILSQHSDTVGPAVACEEYMQHPAFHVAYNTDMTDVAPTRSLAGTHIEWTPYVTGAIRAVLDHRPIEETVDGDVHPLNDMSAGFDKGWVAITPLNAGILPPGTQEAVDGLIDDFRDGKINVFQGDYIAIDPEDESQWIDLHDGYAENADSSIPTFDYILQDVVTVVN